ncbi:hypothetical protein [Acaryochloris sp. CCMEE 5410]|uniref:hypothetical protein n=1 Tax=Acaryochloris sp. CCMEE 5410 TaxID=310037 RepID=UPI0002484701|nr:hypothetical protein [Acaryochloris sp. CCMEE 5410]KAI9129045.1 hypothetical protein ON05_036825 [Acaryochloris sp. CCMEE 5410]
MPESRLGTFWTTQEIADALSKSRQFVVDAINGKSTQRPLQAIKISGKWFVSDKDAQDFIQYHRRKESFVSPIFVARAIGRSRQFVMDAITGYGGSRTPILKAKRQSNRWLISTSDAEEFIQNQIENQNENLESIPVNLTEWFRNHYPENWKPIKELLGERTSLVGFRGAGNWVSRAKRIRLGRKTFLLVASILSLELDREDKQKSTHKTFSIRFQVFSKGTEAYLPDGLKLLVARDSGSTSQIQAGSGRNIDRWVQILMENLKLGDEFSVIITVGDTSSAERFTL